MTIVITWNKYKDNEIIGSWIVTHQDLKSALDAYADLMYEAKEDGIITADVRVSYIKD